MPYKDGLTSLDPEDICYISAADNYCKIVTTNGIVYTVRITLKNLEAILITMPVKDVVILRIHKSHIIALRDIRLNKQITRVQCKDGAVLEISSEGRGKLLQHLVIL
ncbi:MAG: LytTR family transcriptional regulator [Chitinophagaceae bacterium]|nr:LytTR family transcriptional regulator [Chitinophagaceae bacterium]